MPKMSQKIEVLLADPGMRWNLLTYPGTILKEQKNIKKTLDKVFWIKKVSADPQ
jgi:hypothetical protein